jgi:hypothetical protein
VITKHYTTKALLMITLNITHEEGLGGVMFSDHQEGLGGVMFRVITRRASVV